MATYLITIIKLGSIEERDDTDGFSFKAKLEREEWLGLREEIKEYVKQAEKIAKEKSLQDNKP